MVRRGNLPDVAGRVPKAGFVLRKPWNRDNSECLTVGIQLSQSELGLTMDFLGNLVPVALAILILGWVIFRSMMLRSQRNQIGSPQKQVADHKAEMDKRESRGDRALRDAPPEILRWQAEIFEFTREIHGQVDTKIALLAATIRLADERLAELKRTIESAEQLLANPPESKSPNADHSTRSDITGDPSKS